MDAIRISLKTNRGMLKTVLLGLVTLGIYPIVVYSQMGRDMNTLSYRDGKKTMHFCLIRFLVAPLTGGIVGMVWWHRFCNRVGRELERRGMPCKFDAGAFWGWKMTGILLIVGYILGFVYAVYTALPVPQPELFWGMSGLMVLAWAIIGPLVFVGKLCGAMNMLCGDYNIRG